MTSAKSIATQMIMEQVGLRIQEAVVDGRRVIGYGHYLAAGEYIPACTFATARALLAEDIEKTIDKILLIMPDEEWDRLSEDAKANKIFLQFMGCLK